MCALPEFEPQCAHHVGTAHGKDPDIGVFGTKAKSGNSVFLVRPDTISRQYTLKAETVVKWVLRRRIWTTSLLPARRDKTELAMTLHNLRGPEHLRFLETPSDPDIAFNAQTTHSSNWRRKPNLHNFLWGIRKSRSPVALGRSGVELGVEIVVDLGSNSGSI